jgi:hypothetical protein
MLQGGILVHMFSPTVPSYPNLTKTYTHPSVLQLREIIFTARYPFKLICGAKVLHS